MAFFDHDADGPRGLSVELLSRRAGGTKTRSQATQTMPSEPATPDGRRSRATCERAVAATSAPPPPSVSAAMASLIANQDLTQVATVLAGDTPPVPAAVPAAPAGDVPDPHLPTMDPSQAEATHAGETSQVADEPPTPQAPPHS